MVAPWEPGSMVKTTAPLEDNSMAYWAMVALVLVKPGMTKTAGKGLVAEAFLGR